MMTPQISKLISRALENALFKIASVQNGEEALMLVTKTKFKVIISDVKMSKMDGIENREVNDFAAIQAPRALRYYPRAQRRYLG